MYPNLKLQIFRMGLHQNYLAKEVGIDETILSKIINGHREPSPLQKDLISRYLGAEEGWLFEKYDGTSPLRAAEKPVASRMDRNDYSS